MAILAQAVSNNIEQNPDDAVSMEDDFQFDVISEPQVPPARPRPRAKRRQGTVGPAILDDSFLWPDELQTVFGSEHVECLAATLRNAVHVFTDFSGSGAAETAASFIAEGLIRSGFDVGPAFRFQRACDISPLCRKVMTAHRGSMPECILGDQTLRMPAELKQSLMNLHTEYKEKFDASVLLFGQTSYLQSLCDELF